MEGGMLRITAVWSRRHTQIVGRSETVHSIRRAMQAAGALEEHFLTSVPETRTLPAFVRAGGWALGSAFAGRPPSLQALLFADSAMNRAVAEAVERADPDVVVLDGVRTFPLFQALTRRRRVRRIVVDLDDLMSRRMSEYRHTGVVPLGYIGNALPRWVSRLVNLKAPGAALLTYEMARLDQVERLMTRGADAVTLVSSVEAGMLNERVPGLPPERIHVIPPCVDRVRPVEPFRGPLRFIFMGADEQAHNRLTIEYLLDAWRRCRPRAPLVIAGPMKRTWPAVPGVTFTGWIKDVADLYQPGSVMITPAFIRGGIKTKVLQAFAYGSPAVGNDTTFEGLPLAGYPLRFDDAQMRAFLSDLPADPTIFERAAAAGQECLVRDFSREGFERAWKRVLSGGR